MAMKENRLDAMAPIYGNASHPELFGKAIFMDSPMGGVLVTVEVFGLPKKCDFLGMHIHEKGDCTPPFDNTGSHYNPSQQNHPQHAGDLLPILNNNGYGYLSFYTDRFQVKEVLGKSIIIHSMRDDFTTQPSGDAGEKIGCGIISDGIMAAEWR